MRDRTPDALKVGACCMVYEYRAFLAALDCLCPLDRSSCDPKVKAQRNVALESALIHARNIRDFFSPRCPKFPEDVWARDFARELPCTEMPYLRDEITGKMLDKRLAHPSYSRPGLPSDWDLDTLRDEITTAWTAFLNCLEQETPQLRSLFR